MNETPQFGARLKSERKRLGLNQDEAAGVGGVTREMWGKYERDQALPGGEVLSRIASNGFDIAFVLLGERDTASGEPISARDRALLDAYHALAGELQSAVDLLIRAAGHVDAPVVQPQRHSGVRQIIRGNVGNVISDAKTVHAKVTVEASPRGKFSKG